MRHNTEKHRPETRPQASASPVAPAPHHPLDALERMPPRVPVRSAPDEREPAFVPRLAQPELPAGLLAHVEELAVAEPPPPGQAHELGDAP